MSPQENFEAKPKLEYLERWSGVRQMLESGEPAKFFLPELELKDKFFTDNEMLKAIDEHIASKKESLTEALRTLNIDFPDQAWNGSLESTYTEFAKLSVKLLEKTKKELPKYKDKKEEIGEKATEIVGEAYGVPGLGSIVKKTNVGEIDAKTTLKPKNLPQNLKPYAEKKILCDLYIQGKSLNDLGGLYSYLSNLPFEDTAIHRALSSSLHLTNMLGSFVVIKKRLPIDTMEGSNARLGKVQVKYDEENPDSPLGIEASGATPSELTHEISKGLLEYVMLDGSVPAKGEITEEEAKILKDYLERPSVEYFELMYGAPLARRVDDAIVDWIEDLKRESNKLNRRHLERVLELQTGDLDSKPEINLRLLKVISLLPKQDFAEFYQACLTKKIPSSFWKTLGQTKDNVDASLEG